MLIVGLSLFNLNKQPPKVQQKSKAAKMAAATSQRSKKKKWNKGKAREKLVNEVNSEFHKYFLVCARILYASPISLFMRFWRRSAKQLKYIHAVSNLLLLAFK